MGSGWGRVSGSARWWVTASAPTMATRGDRWDHDGDRAAGDDDAVARHRRASRTRRSRGSQRGRSRRRPRPTDVAGVAAGSDDPPVTAAVVPVAPTAAAGVDRRGSRPGRPGRIVGIGAGQGCSRQHGGRRSRPSGRHDGRVVGRELPAHLGDHRRTERHRMLRVRVDRDRSPGGFTDHLRDERDARRATDQQRGRAHRSPAGTLGRAPAPRSSR